MEESKLSMLNANTLELHYWFEDESHSMNAFVQNKCEFEFLGIIKEIARSFNSEILIETEPLANGGLKSYFKLISKEEGRKATITTAVFVAFATAILITPITSSISKVTEKLIERVFEDKELKILDKEKLKLEIEKLKEDIEKNKQLLNENNLIKKKKSNFYETLEKYPKVNKVSFNIENNSKNTIEEEKIVFRQNFKEYILVNDDLEPIEIDEAIIEIISPVLKKGNYKWMGIYNGESIHFNMKSNQFKTLVQTGEIKFVNGTSINCFLVIRKKIDNEGHEITVGYDVLRVNNYFENDNPIETPEGKHYRQKKEADKKQFKLFDNTDNT